MANSITTTGTTSDPISTEHKSGESVAEWVARHDQAVQNSTPSGNLLTTTWPCVSGQEEIRTKRVAGESDALFEQRHIQTYLLAMIECPPVP